MVTTPCPRFGHQKRNKWHLTGTGIALYQGSEVIMKKTYLSIFVIAAGMSMVACSDNSGGGSAAINQCNANPTEPGCIGQPVPLAQVGGNAPVSASVKAFQQNNPGANQV